LHHDGHDHPTSGDGSAKTPDANGYEVVADQNGQAAGETEIMSNLPRTRPQRRSDRRAPAGSEPASPALSTRKPAARSKSKSRVKPPAAEPTPAPGVASLAIGGAVAVAKLPLKVGVQVTLRALDTVARELRSR
jgi:hypothetical protein